jgi:hypothetical protein
MNSTTVITIAAIAAAAVVVVMVMKGQQFTPSPGATPGVPSPDGPPPTQAEIRAGIDLVNSLKGKLFTVPPGKTLPASTSSGGLTGTVNNVNKAVQTGKAIYTTGKGIYDTVKGLF